jgi:hypothetical protein
MNTLEKLKARLENMKEKEILPEISEEMKKVIGEDISGGAEVWANAAWKKSFS